MKKHRTHVLNPGVLGSNPGQCQKFCQFFSSIFVLLNTVLKLYVSNNDQKALKNGEKIMTKLCCYWPGFEPGPLLSGSCFDIIILWYESMSQTDANLIGQHRQSNEFLILFLKIQKHKAFCKLARCQEKSDGTAKNCNRQVLHPSLYQGIRAIDEK